MIVSDGGSFLANVSSWLSTRHPRSFGCHVGVDLFKACTAITVDEVGAIMGHKVSSQDNPGGGVESAKAGWQSVIVGEPQDIAGVGDAAYILVTMTDFGGATAETMTQQATELITLIASKV